MPPFPFNMPFHQSVDLSQKKDVRLIKIFKHFDNNFFAFTCIHMYRLRSSLAEYLFLFLPLTLYERMAGNF